MVSRRLLIATAVALVVAVVLVAFVVPAQLYLRKPYAVVIEATDTTGKTTTLFDSRISPPLSIAKVGGVTFSTITWYGILNVGGDYNQFYFKDQATAIFDLRIEVYQKDASGNLAWQVCKGATYPASATAFLPPSASSTYQTRVDYYVNNPGSGTAFMATTKAPAFGWSQSLLTDFIANSKIPTGAACQQPIQGGTDVSYRFVMASKFTLSAVGSGSVPTISVNAEYTTPFSLGLGTITASYNTASA